MYILPSRFLRNKHVKKCCDVIFLWLQMVKSYMQYFEGTIVKTSFFYSLWVWLFQTA